MDDKYIIHYGNLAGWPYYYAEGLKRLGIKSISVKPIENDFIKEDGTMAERSLPTHQRVCSSNDNRVVRFFKKLRFFVKNRKKIRLIHYHSTTILPLFLDIIYFKLIKIPMIITWGGGDARIVSMARENNPFFYREMDKERDDSIIKKLRFISKYIPYAATDPELAQYSRLFFKKVFIIKQPISLENIKLNIPERTVERPKILHIPTYPKVKGTKHIIKAIEKLEKEGFKFDFKLMEANLTQEETRQEIADCDIYVDELRCGSYGMTAVEAMACGKPVLTFIREDILQDYPEELPIVNSNPKTVYNRIKELLENKQKISDIGRQSRDYVEKYHETEIVCKELLKIYDFLEEENRK